MSFDVAAPFITGNGNSYFMTTKVAAEAFTIPAAIGILQTGGYAVAGDGGGAFYIHGDASTPGGFTDAAGTQWQLAMIAPASQMYGVGRAGVVAAILDANQRKLRSVYIPTGEANIDVNTSIVVDTPGVRLYGNGGPTYNRAPGKNGWLQATNAAMNYILDLGAASVVGVVAENWQVENLAFKQDGIITARSVDGVAFTSRTNGPQRGALIRSSAFINLRNGVVIKNDDVSTNLATLHITDSVFTGCLHCVNAEGRVIGLNFENNQAEQNADSAIIGNFDGPINIKNNMLEGQDNTINISRGVITGSNPLADISYNYFEANGGAYVIRWKSTGRQTLNIGPNYALAITATDYAVLKDTTNSIFITNNDRFPLTFDNCSFVLDYGSYIFKKNIKSYKVRQINNAQPAIIPLNEYINLTDNNASFTHVVAGAGTVVSTPLGSRTCVVGNSFLNIPLAVAEGDLVLLNLWGRWDEIVAGSQVMQVYNQDTTVVVREWDAAGLARAVHGKWSLVSIAFVAGVAATSLRVRSFVGSGTYDTALAALTAKNYGAYVNDGSASAELFPTFPTLPAF